MYSVHTYYLRALTTLLQVGPGGVPAGIDPSLLTSAAFELVQASQALQAVQAVQPMLHGESPPMMTPLQQVGSIGKYIELYLSISKLYLSISNLYLSISKLYVCPPGPDASLLDGPGPDRRSGPALPHTSRLGTAGMAHGGVALEIYMATY